MSDQAIRGWIGMSAAAEYMGMTRRGATRRLQRLQERYPQVKLLRQHAPKSPIEANANTLKAIIDGSVEIAVETHESLVARVKELEEKLEALRNLHRKTRADVAGIRRDVAQLSLTFPQHAGCETAEEPVRPGRTLSAPTN